MRFSVGLSALALGAVLAAAPALAATLNLGGNGNGVLGTGLLGNGTTQSTGNSNVSVNLGSGGTGSQNGGLVDLFGTDNTPTTATATVGNGAGDGNSNVLLNLFGAGGDTGNADANLGLAGLGTGSDPAGAGNVNLDLFGDGTQPVGGLPESGGGAGGGASGGIGDIGAGTSVASLGTGLDGTCFTPNATQLAKLVGRHTYDAATFDGWTGAKTIKVIRAGLCTAAARSLAADGNIGELQTYVGSAPGLRDQLAKWGHAPGDVIAVDRQGSTLIVYVS